MYGLSFVLLSKRNKMAASFITQKGVIRRLPPVPKFSFYAIVFYKNEEGICLHVWNDVSSAIDNNLPIPIKPIDWRLDHAIQHVTFVVSIMVSR